MNDIQPYRQPSGPPGPYQPGPADGYPTQTIEVPGPGLKRDYAGLLEYWQMVRRHKVAVVLATFVGALLGFLVTLSSPRVYQARTSLEIQSLNEEFLNMKSVNPVQQGDTYGGTDIQTQVQILQSRTLVSRVSEKVKALPRPENLQPPDRLGLWRQALKLNPPSNESIWKDALGMAAGSVRARGSDTNRIVTITCDSTNPQVAADFCNTLTTEYIDQNLESRWKSTEYTGDWLTKQLQDLKIKLEQQEEELQTYARATSLMITGEGPDKGGDVNETRLADLQKELSVAQADRFNKQSKFEMASSSPPESLPDVLDDTALKTTQASMSDLQAKLAQLQVTFTPKAPEVRRVQVQIDALEKALAKAQTNAVTRIKKDFEAAQRREALLSKAYDEQAQLVSSKAEETAHYALLKRDVDSTRQLYETLQQRLKESSIAAAMRANNVRVVDTATTPGAPYKPDVSQRVLLGLMFGAVVGVTFSVLRERADRTLQDPGDVSYYLGVPELGVVPIEEAAAVVRAKPVRALANGTKVLAPRAANDGGGPAIETISWFQKTSLLAESFRTTLTSILFSRRSGDRPRVLVLTSASPKEGKTTVVSNLSIALAEIGHNTLVIDADMRRPRLHNVFDVGNDVGLSDLLIGREPLTKERLKEACSASKIPGLFVMPSGNSRRNVSSLLHSDRLPELLKIARETFDTVVVDTPPMVNIADARVLARLSDALILVVRSGSTTRDAALLAMGRFADDGVPVLGTILNFWNPKTPGYSYYRYYYAGYQHYYGDGNGKNGGADDGEGHGERTPSRAPSSVGTRTFTFEPRLREDDAAPERKS